MFKIHHEFFLFITRFFQCEILEIISKTYSKLPIYAAFLSFISFTKKRLQFIGNRREISQFERHLSYH